MSVKSHSVSSDSGGSLECSAMFRPAMSYTQWVTTGGPPPGFHAFDTRRPSPSYKETARVVPLSTAATIRFSASNTRL
jgi:hypothetical protein